MATYTTREVVTRRREWIVPADQPWGAAAAEIAKAWTVAQQSYREAHGLPKDVSLADNALTFHPGDDEIVIAYTVEETQP